MAKLEDDTTFFNSEVHQYKQYIRKSHFDILDLTKPFNVFGLIVFNVLFWCYFFTCSAPRVSEQLYYDLVLSHSMSFLFSAWSSPYCTPKWLKMARQGRRANKIVPNVLRDLRFLQTIQLTLFTCCKKLERHWLRQTSSTIFFLPFLLISTEITENFIQENYF